jgi:hypothetical protein
MHRYSPLIIGLILVFVSGANAGELKVCRDGSANNSGLSETAPPSLAPSNGEASYSGTVRVFLVEPESRWYDHQTYKYSNGFLDFPLVSNVSLGDGEAVYLTNTWDATAAGFSPISEYNIMGIAVVFRSQTVLTDADPPSGYYFQARYADAAAAATPYEIGHNEATPPYTHPVFIEESTATW